MKYDCTCSGFPAPDMECKYILKWGVCGFDKTSSGDNCTFRVKAKLSPAEEILAMKTPDKGISVTRLLGTNPRELAFAAEWISECREISGYGHGCGMLQDMFIFERDEYPFTPYKVPIILTNREKMIVATAIQWLGSNVGMGFLHKALKDCGYIIITQKDTKHYPLTRVDPEF